MRTKTIDLTKGIGTRIKMFKVKIITGELKMKRMEGMERLETCLGL